MYSKVAVCTLLVLAVATITEGAPPSHGKPSHKGTQKIQPKAQPLPKEHQSKNSVPWEVCFYTNWAQYRDAPATFLPEDVDVSLCSHIFFAFANMDGNQLIPYEFNDVEMYGRIQNLKFQKPSLQTVLAVGGWTFGTAKMTLMMSSKDNRTEFIDNVISYITTYGFNGVDLDFEYPASRGSPAIDKAQFTCLLEEMREAFDAYNFLNPNDQLVMSAGVAAGMDNVQPGYDILRVCSALDKVNLMSYDFFGAWDTTASPHAPLYSRVGQSVVDSQKTVEYSATYWSTMGCPKHKMNIGIASYGRSFTLSVPGQGDMGAPVSGKGLPAQYTLTPGIINYFEMCDSFFPSATMRLHPEHQVPYANTTNQWVGYDNPSSVVTKADWIKVNGYGGYMFWSLDHDDFTGLFCQRGAYPILTALHNSMAGYLAPDDPVSPPEPIPPPNINFCNDYSMADGYHKDYYSCSRCYQCTGGATTVHTCQTGQVMNPSSLPNCIALSAMPEETRCLQCYEFCDCDTLVTPLESRPQE